MNDNLELWKRLRREAEELFERAVALQDRFPAADRALKGNDADLKAATALRDSHRARDLNNAAQPEFVEAHRALGSVIEQAIAAQHRAFNAAPLELRDSYQRVTLEAYRRRRRTFRFQRYALVACDR